MTGARGPIKTVEIYVLEQVYAAALIRAKRAGQPLSAVAREVIWRASMQAQKPNGATVAHPARRPTNAKRHRVRLTIPESSYRVARDRIRASGRSVASALEAGLENYARYGTYTLGDTDAPTSPRG